MVCQWLSVYISKRGYFYFEVFPLCDIKIGLAVGVFGLLWNIVCYYFEVFLLCVLFGLECVNYRIELNFGVEDGIFNGVVMFKYI